MDFAERFREQQRIMDERFRQAPNLDSMVFIEIPRPDIKTPGYRIWLMKEVETPWMKSNGNKDYIPDWFWNEQEGGFYGHFGNLFFTKCKLHRYDGTEEEVVPGDYRAKRGLLIRDHYSPMAVAKVLLIADNLQQYLTSQGIQFTKFHFDRASREMIRA